MKGFIAACSFLAPSLFASFSEPPRWEYRTGYRNDRLHWHLQSPANGGALQYSEVYRDVQFWENALALTIYHRDIYFYLNGSYAAFGLGGKVNERYADLPFASNQPHFAFTPQGWAADGEGRFGYCVNLTDGRLYKVLLIPFLGFSGHWESLERQNPKPAEYTSSAAIDASSYTMSSHLPGRLNLTWYGFLLGGFFHIDPGHSMLFDVGYHYSWLHVRFHTHWTNEVILGSPLFTSQSTSDALKAKSGGNVGHTGWAQVTGRLNRGWQVGLGALIHYFASRDFTATEYQHTSMGPNTKTAEKLKIRWTAISGWVSLSRSF